MDGLDRWLELSLVTIPANSEAVITAIKALDREHMAATGRSLVTVPGAPGTSTVNAHKGAVKLIPRNRT